MEKFNEDIKPTLKTPVSTQSQNFEKNFKKTMTKDNIKLTEEVDGLLTEKEFSLKKKIFRLSKMEALVFSDPKLLAVYNEMSEEGEEKYGYHYNETIMNMIFNDYVLNSPKYLQKYKMAIPKEKKRRDKSGINQAKKAGAETIKKMNPQFKVKEPELKTPEEQPMKMAAEGVEVPEQPVKVKFLVNEKDPQDPDLFAYFPEENFDREGKFKVSYSHVGQHSAVHPAYAEESREALPYEYKDLKAELEGIGYNLEVLNQANETTGAGASSGAFVGKLKEEDEENTQHQPDEEDCFIESNGWKYSVSCGGKFIGEFSEMDDALNAVKTWKQSNNWFPNTWFISDHGNMSLIDDEGNILQENTTTASVGGSGMGSGGYAGPAAWGSGDLMKTGGKSKAMRRPIWPGGTIIQESNYLTDPTGFEKFVETLNEQTDVDYIQKHSEAFGSLNNMSPEDKKIIKKDIKTGVMDRPNLNEKSTSKSQQRLFGMAHAVQKGELSPSKVGGAVKKIAKTVSPKDVEDFASTKHDKLPEKINENPALMALGTAAATGAGQAIGNRVADKVGLEEEVQHGEWVGSDVNLEISLEDYNAIANQPANKDSDDEWFVLYKMGNDAYGTGWVTESELNDIVLGKEWANAEEIQRFLSYIGMDAEQWLQMPFISKLTDLISYWGVENIMNTDYSPLNKEEAYAMAGIENTTNEDTQTMIQNNGTSMSNKATPTGDQPSNVDMGARATGGMNESDQRLLEELNNELEAYSIHHNKLKVMAEDRKPSALVLRDRVGSENEKNFKKDLGQSGTKEIIDIEKELQWKDQQTDVPKDPQKLGLDIEKKEIKTTDATGDEHLKNVGDSTNDEGDEIPKRNMTDDEQNEVDMMRLGQHSLVYDNEPSKRFEDRMKADMGDKVYKMRQDQMEYRSKMPTYNKDNQPVQDGEPEKYQFNKEKATYNKQTGINESIVSGKYFDVLNKRRIIDFKLNETVEIVNEKDAEKYFELNFAGMGNTYTNKVDVNESVVKAISTYKFYTDGSTVYRMKTPTQKLNEASQKTKPVINEQFEKMKHLTGYKPSNFVDTKNVKKNRGF